MKKIYFAAALLLGVCFGSCTKEDIDQPDLEQGGSISGVVRYCPEEEYNEQTNLPLFPLEHVKAVLINAAGQRLDSLTTSPEGQINFINLPQGQYSVLLSHPKTGQTLTLKATVTGKQIVNLVSEGFNCVNFQLYKVAKRKWTFIHIINNSEGTIATGNLRNLRIQEKFGGSGGHLYNVAFMDCGQTDSKLIYLLDPNFVPEFDPINEPMIRPKIFSPAYVYDREGQNYAITGDMGDYKAMQRKIEQIASLYPSDSIALFIGSHGSGIAQEGGFNQTRSISPNPSTLKEITIPQFREMLTNLNAKGLNVGFVATTACFMGMFEVGYELKDTGVKFLLATETAGATLIDGERPVEYIKKFKDGIGTTFIMASEICQKPKSNVFALFDLRKIGRMTELYNNFAEKVNKTPIKYTQPTIWYSTKCSDKGGMSMDMPYNYYDLGDYALQLTKAEFTDDYGLKPAAQALYDYIKDRSGYIAAMGVSNDTDWHKRLTGLSTLMIAPGNNYSEYDLIYRDHLYYKDGNTQWDSFLTKINWDDPAMEVWDGTASVPTQMTDTEVSINIPSELAWVAQQVNTGAQTFSGKKIIIKKELDMGGRNQQNWTPIGTAENPFKGEFNGENHHIYRLYINSSTLNNAGLFGYTLDAAFANCQFEEASINITESATNASAPLNVGILCGVASTLSTQSTLMHSRTSGYITVNASTALTNTGGLVGELKGNWKVEFNEGAAKVSLNSKGQRMASAGGLIGNCGAGGAMAQITLDKNMFSNNTVMIISDGDASGGGLIGSNENAKLKIINAECSSDTNVSAEKYAYAGGIIGSSTKQVTIIRANNMSTVTASVATPGTHSRAYAGGLVGATSVIMAGCSSTGAVNGNDLRGGLGAELDGTVIGCNSVTPLDTWAIAARIPAGSTLTAKDTYYHTPKGAVGEGNITRNNCEQYSQTKWPTNEMRGWNGSVPEGISANDWGLNSPWVDLGHWDAQHPVFPEMKQLIFK